MNEIKENKTADKTTYNREYMRQRYKENSDKCKNMRKAYYYKQKYGLDANDVKTYGEHLHLIVKVKKLIQEIQDKCPQHLEKLI